MSFPKIIAGALLLGSLATGGIAVAGPDAIGSPAGPLRLASGDDGGNYGATAPGEAMSMSELLRELAGQGYDDIREVEREGARYEVKARDRNGRWRELYVDTQTGKVIGEEDDD